MKIELNEYEWSWIWATLCILAMLFFMATCRDEDFRQK